ncbi:MAG: tRNA uridine-5-carboxymethylaminomethyl(34) synthesis enzyme MnmG [Phycisphaerales bacterium]
MRERYDIIIIGGGHAGTEAAWAAANALRPVDGRVALITMDPSKMGAMSCNPAIGGLAKGQIVREIDALGGLMGLATDATGIQFRMLNMSKGPAVRGPRAQCDKYAYASEVQRLIALHPAIDVIAGCVDELLVESAGVPDGGRRIRGVRLPAGCGIVHATPGQPAHLRGEAAQPLFAATPAVHDRAKHDVVLLSDAVVLTTGTFMRALMHTGEERTQGGRIGEGSAVGISAMLRSLGFDLGRLKTGTPPRLARGSIDFSATTQQWGDAVPVPFSDRTLGGVSVVNGMRRFPVLEQVCCYATQTTAAAHEVIRANLHRAPMYNDAIDAECGPRYCPSIEDKVVRFADRESHHVFLEPESLYTSEIYCNGISTSLPLDVQKIIVQAMPGCEQAEIIKPGYAVEYDMVWPHQIDATCMTKRVYGLFLAGQINGTSGYEEAGGQGLIAGLNAAMLARGNEMIRLGREQAYIGVMMDDLVTKTPREPYRMFTSRAEHRLLLRSDNADARLTPLAREHGLIDDDHWDLFEQTQHSLAQLRDAFQTIRIEGRTLCDRARQPRAGVADVQSHLPDALASHEALIERTIVDYQYEGYVKRQHADIKRQRRAATQMIPDGFDFTTVNGLRSEAREALLRFQPGTMGQAGRIAGVNPADMTILAVALKRQSE